MTVRVRTGRCCRRVGELVIAIAAIGVLWAPARASADDARPGPKLYAFFATWCVPCKSELPHIEKLHRDYASRGLDVTLVSEDAPSSAQNIPAFLARYGVTARWVLDNESELLERFNPQANVPFTVVVDSSGKVVYAHAGYEPGDERLIEQAVISALDDAAAPEPDPEAGDAVASDTPTLERAVPLDKPWVRVTASTTGLGVWRTSRFDPVMDNDGVLKAAVGRAEVAGYSDRYSASVRVDGAFVDDEITGRDNDARLERARASAKLGPVTLTAGDDYVQFGQGLALSLRKVDPLGVDTSLRGARADTHLGEARVTALAGWTNPQNLDPIGLQVVDPEGDFIAGGEARIPIGDSVAIAPYGVYSVAGEAGGAGEDVVWAVGGVSTTASAGGARLSLDVAGGQRTGMALADETPMAAYASFQYQLGRVTTLVDAKAYRHWQLGRADQSLLYHEPPTLEREDQEVPGNEDAIGARTRVEVRLPSRVSVFGNALGYQFSQDDSSPVGGDLAVHGYAGVEKRFASNASASIQSGYRREQDATGEVSLEMVHGDFDASMELVRDIAMTLKWNHREETKFDTFNPLEFRRGLAVAGVSLSGVGALSVLWGYSTERATDPTHYPGAELSAHLPSGGVARLFAGMLTGGRICVSGSCRDVPPFKGARMDVTLRF